MATYEQGRKGLCLTALTFSSSTPLGLKLITVFLAPLSLFVISLLLMAGALPAYWSEPQASTVSPDLVTLLKRCACTFLDAFRDR